MTQVSSNMLQSLCFLSALDIPLGKICFVLGYRFNPENCTMHDWFAIVVGITIKTYYFSVWLGIVVVRLYLISSPLLKHMTGYGSLPYPLHP